MRTDPHSTLLLIFPCRCFAAYFTTGLLQISRDAQARTQVNFENVYVMRLRNQRDWLDIDSRNGPTLQVASCLLLIHRELIMACMMVVPVFLSLVWLRRGHLSKFWEV